MHVQELMSRPAVTCRSTDTLNTAAQLMWEQDCGALPVVDDGGGIVGMITDRDICMAAYTQGNALHAIAVASSMAKEVFYVRADDPLDAARRLMSDKQVRRLPVVDRDNRPVGVLSLDDIGRSAGARRKEGLDRDLAETLAAICKPRTEAQRNRQPRS